ncbi:MAG: nucleotidyl transferase AbiEii/AbiGii toxin family protein [Bacteroidia bacterium]
MRKRQIDHDAIAEVAKALKELKNSMVFIGGAVLSLYSDDPKAGEVRPTTDIDLTIKMIKYGSWAMMEERLAELMIFPDPFGRAICSYKYEDISIDIMPSEENPIGPLNPWYQKGFEDLLKIEVIGEEIQIFSAPVYLATKFEAFNGRGNDYRMSHDFEDIIYVLDNRSTIVEEIARSDLDVKEFIQTQLVKIKDSRHQFEIIASHLDPYLVEERLPIILSRIGRIVEPEND